MKPPLKFEGPSLCERIFFGFVAVFVICFASVFVALPLIHIARELSAGNVPWPLIGFAALSMPFGGLMMWIGIRYRVWVLPYQFTVDTSQMTCGYLWKKSWVDRVDLSGVNSLVTAPAYSRRMWPWVIYASFGDDRDRKAIFNSHASYSCEIEAFERSFETCFRIADYLGVPIEFDEWSQEITLQHNLANKTSLLTPDPPRVRPVMNVPSSTPSSNSAPGQA